jgi:RimJ/RimL family protein N-acetyltransferase
MRTIEGERLFLREIQPAELTDSVMSWFSNEDLMKFYTNSKTAITKERLLASIEEGKAAGTTFTYGVYSLESKALIGTIKLGPINHHHKTSDLVALIGDPAFHGKGLGVEAIQLGGRLAFEVHDLRKLYGGMYMSNIASIKAYRKAGWLVEGRLKGQFLVDGHPEDRLLVGCFNPAYFSAETLEEIKLHEDRYI